MNQKPKLNRENKPRMSQPNPTRFNWDAIEELLQNIEKEVEEDTQHGMFVDLPSEERMEAELPLWASTKQEKRFHKILLSKNYNKHHPFSVQTALFVFFLKTGFGEPKPSFSDQNRVRELLYLQG